MFILRNIKENCENEKEMIRIFDLIADLNEEFKTECVLRYLESNTDLNLFKTIHLGRKSDSWSASQIPIIEKAIDYYKTIKSKIKELQKE